MGFISCPANQPWGVPGLRPWGPGGTELRRAMKQETGRAEEWPQSAHPGRASAPSAKPLVAQYGECCLITDCRIPPLVEFAYLYPYQDEAAH